MSSMLLGLVGLVQASSSTATAPAPNVPNMAAYCDLLERKADRNNVEIHDLATCFYRGEGRPRDLPRARALYAQATEVGFTRSMCALGNMMINGLGGAREVDRGLALCRRAAEAGEAQAQTDLGNYLLTGEVVARDVVEARRWYNRAAEQGQANAAFVLGQIYWNGDGIAKDYAEAARWWRIAHERGRPDAAYLLGREAFVRVARGVTRPADADPAVIAEALRWFELAAQTHPNPAEREDAARQVELLRQLQAMTRQRAGQ